MFVRDLPQSLEDQAITTAIISMAKTLGAKVIAEGVENRSQSAMLSSMGCDQFQGFLFGRPEPAIDIVKRLKSQ
jgi:EAL domain-containing protein (putative c-di-GMP-specific phosphodiesterase class I)